ncbi:hypothetical protein [Planctomycetes bacterium K23_9]|uniref:Glycosyltransferase RgtA/B/C/D-like domain-containing protein n=1 Tax=Stieleria marina TaxID=1930275 RepID=A0A517NYR3_9BACT|nr:hypothetical protein K239x_42830 [Planctomycetes bacterium K23_9]
MDIVIGLIIAVAAIGSADYCIRRLSSAHIALHDRRNLLYFALFAWVAITFHRCFIWLPSHMRASFDGHTHERAARRIARELQLGSMGLDELEWLSNYGYRSMIGVFYALTDSPIFATYIIHAMAAFIGLLLVLESVVLVSRVEKLPTWVILYALFLPSALIFTPWNMKEGPVLWGIGLIIRFSVASLPNVNFPSRTKVFYFISFVGAALFFLLRPHIFAAWLVACAAPHALSFKRPGSAFFSVLILGVSFVLFLGAVQILAPGFTEQVAQRGIVNQLDAMTDQDLGGSTIVRNAVPIPVLSGLVFILFEPNPTTWGNFNFAIVGVEAWFSTLMIAFQWSRVADKKKLLFSPAVVICVVALLAISFYLGFMYNMGLMVRQRLQIMPACILLATLPLGVTAMNIPAISRRPVAFHRT